MLLSDNTETERYEAYTEDEDHDRDDLETVEHHHHDQVHSDHEDHTEPIDPNTISAAAFAISILRNTQLPKHEVQQRTQIINQNFPTNRITLEEFVNFNEFLLNMHDFAEVLRFMEKVEGYEGELEAHEEEHEEPSDISAGESDDEKDEDDIEMTGQYNTIHGFNQLKKAVHIATNIHLSDQVIAILYNLFDINNDGSISYNEIISVFRSRLERSQRSHLEAEHKSFGHCIHKTGYQLRLRDNL